METNEASAAERGSPFQRYALLCLWMFIGFVYLSLMSQWITFSTHDKQFAQSMQRSIQIAATEQRPARELRALLLIRAEELSIPIRGDEIHISGAGSTLRVNLRYNADISMPILNQTLYRMKFGHDLTFEPLK
jgi:hypothetical protein